MNHYMIRYLDQEMKMRFLYYTANNLDEVTEYFNKNYKGHLHEIKEANDTFLWA